MDRSTESSLHQLLGQVAAGAIAIDTAVQRLLEARIGIVDGATIDLGRSVRCGLPEVIYGEGKAPDLIVSIARQLLQDFNEEILVTRLEPAEAMTVAAQFHEHRYSSSARSLRIALRPIRAPEADGKHGPVVVITAGSTDRAVADEAAETLGWMDVTVRRLHDVGVAGPQRLLSSLDTLRGCCAGVVVAGMEGALPSVVAGHVGYPVIAVPTSVGYGAAFGGFTALLSMLTSCAANVSVVNIDAGFKAGFVAGLIARGHNSQPLRVN